jgi:hypothetical protein
MTGEREPVTIELSADEALVLFDWLGRATSVRQPAPFVDPAERQVLCTLECLLERVLVEPFDPDYAVLVEEARGALRGHSQ